MGLRHPVVLRVLCMCEHDCILTHTAPEASWRRGFDPCTPLRFDLYHYLEQNGYFWLVPELAPGPSSQVLPGCRVRHPCYSQKLFVRPISSDMQTTHTYIHDQRSWCKLTHTHTHVHNAEYPHIHTSWDIFMSVWWCMYVWVMMYVCVSMRHHHVSV